MEPLKASSRPLELEALPAEILIQIFCHLDSLSFRNTLQVSRALNKTSRQETLWRALLPAHFGSDWESGFKYIPSLSHQASNMELYYAMSRELEQVFTREPVPGADPAEMMANTLMSLREKDAIMKIAVIGEEKPGKTALIYEFEHLHPNRRYNADLHPNIFHSSTPHLPLPGWLPSPSGSAGAGRGVRVLVQIFDIFSGERLFHIPPFCHRGAHGFVFVFDLTRESTFTYLETYAKDLEIYHGFNYESRSDEFPIVMVVGTHYDKVENCAHIVSQERIRNLCISIGALYLETSITPRKNIDEVFLILASRIWRSKFWRERLVDPRNPVRPAVQISSKRSTCNIQ